MRPSEAGKLTVPDIAVPAEETTAAVTERMGLSLRTVPPKQKGWPRGISSSRLGRGSEAEALKLMLPSVTGAGVAVGTGVGVGTGAGVGAGVGTGVGVGSGVGDGVGVGSGVGSAVGSAVGSSVGTSVSGRGSGVRRRFGKDRRRAAHGRGRIGPDGSVGDRGRDRYYIRLAARAGS